MAKKRRRISKQSLRKGLAAVSLIGQLAALLKPTVSIAVESFDIANNNSTHSSIRVGPSFYTPFADMAQQGNSRKVLQDKNAVFTDIDADKDYDAFVTTHTGEIAYYENIGNNTMPNFALRSGRSNPLYNVYIATDKVAVFVDPDLDEDLDVVVSRDEKLDWFYENVGNGEHPLFFERIASRNKYTLSAYTTSNGVPAFTPSKATPKVSSAPASNSNGVPTFLTSNGVPMFM